MGRLPRRITDTLPDLPDGFVEHCRRNNLHSPTLDALAAELKKYKAKEAT